MLAHIQQLLHLFSWKPFDTNTEQGRAKERHRRILWTTLASGFAKLTGILASIITIPLTFHYLGVERFGLWMLFNTFVVFANFADIGMGYGLINMIADAKGKNDQKLIQTYIVSGMSVLWIISFILAIIFGFVFPLIQWEKVFNVTSPQAVEESYAAMWVFGCCFILAIPLNIIQKILSALQRGFSANSWQGLANLSSFIGIISGVYFQASMTWLVFALVGLPLLVMLGNNGWFFYFNREAMGFQFSLCNGQIIVQLLKRGIIFFILHFCGVIAIAMDNILIAQWLGASAVSYYAVSEKLFSIISLIILLFILPLWAAYTEAFAKGDLQWIKKTLKRSIILSLSISMSLGVVLMLAGQNIIALLVNKDMEIPTMLWVGFGIWKIIESLGMTLSIFLNGVHVVSQQAMAAIIWAVFSIFIKILFIERFGIVGVIWGSSLAYSLCMLFPFIYLVRAKILEIKSVGIQKGNAGY
ncbi:MAG: hypothetical protein RIT27_307 [Pseudomonadota bacterium]|jgi:O-antigen/teichoic acid export membrane protein